MISVITALCSLQWLDSSGSRTETRINALASATVGQVEAALQSYRAVALAISDCAITDQEITYEQVVPQSSLTLPGQNATSKKSMVLVFSTTQPNIFFPVVIPSPKSTLFTSDAIPTIDATNASIQTFANAIIGAYLSPEGYAASQMVAAVYSEEF